MKTASWLWTLSHYVSSDSSVGTLSVLVRGQVAFELGGRKLSELAKASS